MLFIIQLFFSSLITRRSTWKRSSLFLYNMPNAALSKLKLLQVSLCIQNVASWLLCTRLALQQQLNLGSHPPLVYLLLLTFIVTSVQGTSTTQICSETSKVPPNPSETPSVEVTPNITISLYSQGT